MRTIGFIGILLLAILNAVGLAISLQEGNWKGIGLMLFMVVLLVYFAHTLWRGRKLSRSANTGERLAQGWGGETVGSFVTNQVAKSLDGRILIIGSGLCVAMATLSSLAPEIIFLSSSRSARAATLFAVWPILAFVLYVRICGPAFKTTAFNTLSMLSVVGAPFVLAYT